MKHIITHSKYFPNLVYITKEENKDLSLEEPAVISKLLGHTLIDTILERYAQTNDDFSFQIAYINGIEHETTLTKNPINYHLKIVLSKEELSFLLKPNLDHSFTVLSGILSEDQEIIIEKNNEMPLEPYQLYPTKILSSDELLFNPDWDITLPKIQQLFPKLT